MVKPACVYGRFDEEQKDMEKYNRMKSKKKR